MEGKSAIEKVLFRKPLGNPELTKRGLPLKRACDTGHCIAGAVSPFATLAQLIRPLGRFG
jgi:hypothetical protein